MAQSQSTTNPFNPPVAQDPVMIEEANTFSFSWYQWFATKVARALFAPVSSAAPATSQATGAPGQIAYDQNFLYIATGVNQWKRIPLTAF